MTPIRIVSIVILISALSGGARAASRNAAVEYLLFSNSARANGMGATVITLADEQSALFNPGAMGVFHLDHNLALAGPSSTKWLKRVLPGLRLKSIGVSAGFAVRGGINADRNSSTIGLSAAIFKTTFKYPEIRRTSAIGNPLGTETPLEKSRNYTLAVGVDKGWRAGLGVTYKRVTSELALIGAGATTGVGAGNANVFDLGFYFEAPLHKLSRTPTHTESGVRLINYRLTPALALVRANVGSQISYIDPDQPSPLPEVTRIGLAVTSGVNRGHASLASLRLAYEAEFDHVGDIKRLDRFGAEISGANTVFLRIGRFTLSEPQENVNTWGIGMDFLGPLFVDRDRESNSGFFTISSIKIDIARYSGGVYSGTQFFKIQISS